MQSLGALDEDSMQAVLRSETSNSGETNISSIASMKRLSETSQWAGGCISDNDTFAHDDVSLEIRDGTSLRSDESNWVPGDGNASGGKMGGQAYPVTRATDASFTFLDDGKFEG